MSLCTHTHTLAHMSSDFGLGRGHAEENLENKREQNCSVLLLLLLLLLLLSAASLNSKQFAWRWREKIDKQRAVRRSRRRLLVEVQLSKRFLSRVQSFISNSKPPPLSHTFITARCALQCQCCYTLIKEKGGERWSSRWQIETNGVKI